MCGIVGIYAYRDHAQPIDPSEIDRIRDFMALRGPDGSGAWVEENSRIGLGHRRLSIIDLSDHGAQPMVSADGRYVVTFNGEIYNYRELRTQLEAKGHVFHSQSDTEVLLHLYAEKGRAMVEDLRGMFAFGLWDREKRGLLLARDPFGIKPLYFADDGSTIRFASQVKALLAGGRISREVDLGGQAGFYLFGAVPEPFTTYRSIKALTRGSTLWIDNKGAEEPLVYFSIGQLYREAEDATQYAANARDAQTHISAALLDSVRHHLVSDVPVGAFLSAGVDSGSLVGLMRDASQSNIETITLAFEEFRGKPADEAPFAQNLAGRYGTQHTTRRVSKREFEDDLPRILAAMDQPSIDGINTWFVSKVARERGLKVAISGLGGDELLGGYSTFHEVPALVRSMALPSRLPHLGSFVHAAVTKASRFWHRLNPKWAEIVNLGGNYPSAYMLRRSLFVASELAEVMGEEEARTGLERLAPDLLVTNSCSPSPRTAFGRIASLETAFYMCNQLLRDADWASMAHSLEVRLPLVDAWLLRKTAPYMVGSQRLEGKTLLANAPSLALPREVTNRAKTGFSMPYETWIPECSVFAEARHHLRVPATAIWSRRWAEYVARFSA